MNMQNCLLPSALPLSYYLGNGITKVLVLDFDGVFNAAFETGTTPKEYFDLNGRSYHPNPSYKGYNRRNYGGSLVQKEHKSFLLAWSKELVDEVNRIASDPTVQVVWLTTWQTYMGDVETRLGFKFANPSVYLPFGVNVDSSQQVDKLPAFKNWLGNVKDSQHTLKLVWVDDVMVSKVVDFLSNFLDEGTYLSVKPLEKYGISRSEWEDIKSFLEN